MAQENSEERTEFSINGAKSLEYLYEKKYI